MKKIIKFVSIFAFASILITYLLIILNKKEVTNISNTDFAGKIIEKIKPEETIDLYGTFKVNNINIVKKNISIDGINKEINVFQISGLKDKTVEEKINSSIEDRVCEFFKSNYEKTNYEVENMDLDNMYFNDGYINANFSNVISITYYYSYYENDEENNIKYGIRGDLYLNYNLVDGEKILLEDLFKNEDDIENVVQVALYKNWEQEEENFYMDYMQEEPYYDIEQGEWYQRIGEYNELIDAYEYKIVEYIPKMTEYEISKMLRKYMNSEEKQFYFTQNTITIDFDVENSYYKYGKIPFQDICDKIVIYNKYLIKNNIFEDNNEPRNMVNCTAENTNSKYKNTQYYKNNLFYDIDVQIYEDILDYGKNYPYNEYYYEKIDEFYKKGLELIDEYKYISEHNNNQYYVLFVEIIPTKGGLYGKSYTSLISFETKAKLIICEINEKKELLDKVLEVYREDVRFVGCIYDAISSIEYSYDLETNEQIKEVDINEIKSEYNFFDAESEKEINSIDELFKDGIDYKSALLPYIYSNLYYYIPQLDTNSLKYSMNSVGIEVSNQDEYYAQVYYEDIIDYLNIKQVKIKILPSSEILLQNYDVDYMSKEDLDYAYNEIFARHGQDFKNQKYKEYFRDFYWYNPIDGKDVSLDELNETERANLKFIQDEIDSRQ